ncbi:prominin-1-like [Montipora capricornis]|uniref:prominin-1-like n=1 Tax=Montipora capricornis TaxID=246305 RepID=UPI0035F1DDCD
MASFMKEMKEKILVSIVALTYITSFITVDGKGVLNGDNITFSTLRQGSNYTLKKSKNDWFLASYDTIAEAVVLSVNYSPPYDAIKDAIRNYNRKGNNSVGYIINEVITENVPITVLTSISLICAFVIPLVGIIFGCFRCKGKCGGELIEEDLETNPKKKRRLFTAAISVCSAFIMVAAFSISLVNDKTETAIPELNSMFMSSIVDIAIYEENTLKELSEVTGENMNFTSGLILQELSYLPVNISTPLIQQSQQSVDTLLNDVREMGIKLTDLRDSLKDVSDTVLSLRSLGQKLRAGLDEARNNLTKAKDDCNNDPPSVEAGACDKIPAWDDLQAEADFNQVPDTAEELSNIEAILSKNDFGAQATEGRDTFNSIPAKVYEATFTGTEEIKDFTKELQDFASKMVASLEKDANLIQTEILLPMKGEVQSIFGNGGLLNRYDKYRWILLLSISLAVVFVVLLTFLSLISGALGASPSDTPSTRSDTSNCAGKALMCVVGLYFFLAFFVNLILAITFFLGANATVLCKSAADLTLLEKTIDDPSTLGYYPISKAVLGNGIIEIQLSDILRRCNQHETPWELLRLDQKFNFENMTSYKSKIPSMDEVLARLNDTLISVRLVSDDTRKAVNDTFSSGVQEIEYFKYSTETAKPLLKNSLSLEAFANDLETAAAEQVSAGVAEKLRSTKDTLKTLDDGTVKTSQPVVSGLTQKSQILMTKNMNVMNDANRIDLSRVKFRNILEGEGLVLANEAGKKSLTRILSWMDQYLEDSISKLRNDVGDCHPVRNVYDVIVSDLCDNAVSLVNTMWLCLGDIALLSVVTIILCVRLAKHLRRAKNGEDSYSEELGTSNYGVPTRLFDRFPKLNTKRFTVPWPNHNAEMEELVFLERPRAIRHRPPPLPLAITKVAVMPVITDI